MRCWSLLIGYWIEAMLDFGVAMTTSDVRNDVTRLVMGDAIYLVCNGRLSRSLMSCLSLNRDSLASPQACLKSIFCTLDLVERLRASPTRGRAGTALDAMNSGLPTEAYLKSFLAGKYSHPAKSVPQDGIVRQLRGCATYFTILTDSDV